MRSSQIITLARRRAGITQGELAERAGIPRSNLSRYERDVVRPPFERLCEIVEACGLELVPELVTFDGSSEGHILRQLTHDPLNRIRTMGGDAGQVGAVADALSDLGARYVAIGAIAACLRGSPRALGSSAIEIVVGTEEIAGLEQELVDRLLSGSLKMTAHPPHTAGVEDLLADADEITLEGHAALRVASVIDLLRIAQHAGSEEPSPSILLDLLAVNDGRRPEAERRDAELLAAVGG